MTGWAADRSSVGKLGGIDALVHTLERSIAPFEAGATDEACERTAAPAAVF